MMMKTNNALVAFLALALILATFQDGAEANDPMKNRRLLSKSFSVVDLRRRTAEANNVGDDEDSTPENNTHHLLPNQNYNKPPN